MADLEHILQQLHDSEIIAGVQTFYEAGMRVWIGDEINGIHAETTINRTAAARLKWPEGLNAASWLHETAIRLYPDSQTAFASQMLGAACRPLRGAADRSERDYRLSRCSIRIGIRASKRKHQSL